MSLLWLSFLVWKDILTIISVNDSKENVVTKMPILIYLPWIAKVLFSSQKEIQKGTYE